MSYFTGVVVFILVIWIANCLNVLREYERAVVFRLGRLQKGYQSPGLIFILWPIGEGQRGRFLPCHGPAVGRR
jgi:regulator of protease activity HflC (stomatin/prohibitin superfamily)